jgi:hypothetical protein
MTVLTPVHRWDMVTSGLIVGDLSQIISQATAPAFLLGAVAGVLNVLIGRLNRIVDRSNSLAATEDNDSLRGHLKIDITHLNNRAKLITKAIEFAIVSGVFTTLLVIVAFASAALGLIYAYGASLLFVLALGFFSVSLIYLWVEVRIALNDLVDRSGPAGSGPAGPIRPWR